MNILGISAFYHDSAAVLLVDGEIVAAAQEERFTRKKHDAGFPTEAVQYCLEASGIRLADLECVIFYERPFLKFDRLLKTYLTYAPRGYESFRQAAPIWIGHKLFHKRLIARSLRGLDSSQGWAKKVLFTEHHLSHAASAFFPSPFEEAVILTIDGVGEWATTTVGHGRGNKIEILREIHFPHSLGLLYSAFTYYAGFKVNSGEYKLMGLAPYGEPRYKSMIFKHLIDVKPDGSFRLNMEFFNYCIGLTMTNKRFEALFGLPARAPSEPLQQEHMDIAASVQAVLEDIILKMTRDIAKKTSVPNLCLAGGVALNCVSNGKIVADGQFRNIWIQPASGDSGGALGAALIAHHHIYDNSRKACEVGDGMRGAFLGPEFSQAEIERRLGRLGAHFSTLNDEDLIKASATSLAAGEALGWFQGRMEFGPRALGARSILADARSPNMQSKLNLKVKRRESFRPFAPSVLRERAEEYFDLSSDSPYMLLVANVNRGKCRERTRSELALFGISRLNVIRSDIPAVTHVDYSARIQTVHLATNPRFHALISALDRLTGCPVVVNTSFNVRGEPIVCSPEDAFNCFMNTEIESLAIGNCFLRKHDQEPRPMANHLIGFEAD